MTKKVLHCIGALHKGGGAEEVLYQLASKDKEWTHVIVSLQGDGYYSDFLRKAGVKVFTIGLSRSPFSVFRLFKLFRLIKAEKPDVIQTWLYYSDFIGGLIGRLAGVKNIVWGIHHTTHDNTKSSFAIRATHKLCAKLSSNIPKEIISCSATGLDSHVKAGYKKQKMHVVHNGYDLDRFHPDAVSAENIRKKFGLEGHFLMAMLGRWDPQKDHRSLCTALSVVKHEEKKPWACVLFGSDMHAGNQGIASLIEEFDLQGHVFLGGLVDDVAGNLVQLDLKVLSSSFGEAFPNVLNEAMACAIPCVTTDVGDSAKIVGDCGWVSLPKRPEALAVNIADAMQEFHENVDAWTERKKKCRQRILENFTVWTMIEQYHKVWSAP